MSLPGATDFRVIIKDVVFFFTDHPNDNYRNDEWQILVHLGENKNL